MTFQDKFQLGMPKSIMNNDFGMSNEEITPKTISFSQRRIVFFIQKQSFICLRDNRKIAGLFTEIGCLLRITNRLLTCHLRV